MYLLPEFAAAAVAEDPSPAIRALSANFGKPGLSTRRAVDADEVCTLLDNLQTAKSRVRVYSSSGFVPNSYRSHCTIQYVEAKLVNGVWQIFIGSSGAQRSSGQGSLVVVQ